MNAILQQLELNQTFLHIFCLFWGFFFVFSRVVLNPLGALVLKRLEKTREERARLVGLADRVAVARTEAEGRARALKAEAEVQREAARRELDAEYHRQVGAVRDQIRADAQLKAKALSDEEEVLAQSVDREMPGLVGLATEKLGLRRMA